MIPFLAAQGADPFDPVPMLILADHLEEQGDPVGAGVMRGLAEAGIPSIADLAVEASHWSRVDSPDILQFKTYNASWCPGCGEGRGDLFALDPHGYGRGEQSDDENSYEEFNNYGNGFFDQ